MAILVSGNPGSGKSTLAAELVRRGIRAVDADEVHGLAAWMNADGQVVGGSALTPTPELLKDCFWGWSASRIDQVIEELGPRGVLLGIAANQWDYVDRFDALVLLELDAETQRQRVSARHALFQEQIQAGLPIFQDQMIKRGALRLSAHGSTTEIAEALIARLRPGPDTQSR